ncbi:MAG: right-handed parallel beta-helix repeat-containing protein [Candidatus Eiseniibacteriota bacterium]|jgi:hypothetical protein
MHACPIRAARRGTTHLRRVVPATVGGLAVLALALVAAATATAATWIVEAGCDPPNEDCDCSEIQPCIDMAAPGDSVLVLGGTYAQQTTRTVDIDGSPVDITASVFMRDGIHLIGAGPGARAAARDPLAIIDGGGAGIGIFASGVSAGTLIENLTIQNGRANGPTGSWNSVGGGLLCVESSPTVRGNVFNANDASGQGGGMYCELDSSPLVEQNLFVANRAGLEGGGFACFGGAPELRDNTFSTNTAENGAAVRYIGGGAIADNTFTFNLAGVRQGDIELGPGLQTGPTVLIERNLFYSNSGALWVVTNPTTTLSQNTHVLGRTAIRSDATTDAVEIFSNIIVSCEVAGVSIDPATVPNLSFQCNDVWDNEIDYDRLPDQTGMNSNISADPLHCNPSMIDFTLADNSPCTENASPCGIQIGAFGAACPPSAIEATTWGAIKSSYR